MDKRILIALIVLLLGLDVFIFTRPDKPVQGEVPQEVMLPATVRIKKESIVVVVDDKTTDELIEQRIRDNLSVHHGRIIEVRTSANIEKAGEYPVKVVIVGDDYSQTTAEFSVIISTDGSIDPSTCGRVWVIDSPAHTEQRYVVDVEYQPAVTQQYYVKDADAIPETGHYEEQWIIDVQGKDPVYEWVVDQPAHFETQIIHHDAVPAVTHEEPVYKTTTLYTYYDAEGNVVRQRTAEDVGSDPTNVMFEYDHYTADSNYQVQTGTVTITDQPAVEAWDEEKQVFVAEQGHYNYSNIIEEGVEEQGHYGDVWVVDTPGVPEQGHWETTVIREAVEEQGHYEDVEVEEQGHYEFTEC